jgi:AAA ATPase domain
VGTPITDVRFVGRGEELAALAAAYAAADGERASLVVVGGDAGVGKTRLLAEFSGGLDAMVLRGGCLPLGATGLPFSPVVEVLRALAGEGGSTDGLPPVLAGLVPGHPAGPAPAPSSQAQLFQAFLGLLERLAAGRAVVLVLEDLHGADRSTRQHPLRPLLAELRRNARARRVERSLFAPAVGAEYLAAATGRGPRPRPWPPWSTAPRATPSSSRS